MDLTDNVIEEVQKKEGLIASWHWYSFSLECS